MRYLTSADGHIQAHNSEAAAMHYLKLLIACSTGKGNSLYVHDQQEDSITFHCRKRGVTVNEYKFWKTLN